jgi:hypothetical protein
VIFLYLPILAVVLLRGHRTGLTAEDTGATGET